MLSNSNMPITLKGYIILVATMDWLLVHFTIILVATMDCLLVHFTIILVATMDWLLVYFTIILVATMVWLQVHFTIILVATMDWLLVHFTYYYLVFNYIEIIKSWSSSLINHQVAMPDFKILKKIFL